MTPCNAKHPWTTQRCDSASGHIGCHVSGTVIAKGGSAVPKSRWQRADSDDCAAEDMVAFAERIAAIREGRFFSC